MSKYSEPSNPIQNQTTKKALGDHGENQVELYLKKHGFTILERNYQKFYGEIDIIAHKKDLLAFIEVKTRNTTYFSLSELITPSKQRKIIKTAEAYIATKNYYDTVFRFDVALLSKTEDGLSLTYIPNAFSKPEGY